MHEERSTLTLQPTIRRQNEAMSSYSPGIPTSFDPAILSSELDFDALNSVSHSDDFEALQQCIAEQKDKKNEQGVVIQHRAWRTVEIFRSEGEATIGTATWTRAPNVANSSRHSSEEPKTNRTCANSVIHLN